MDHRSSNRSPRRRIALAAMVVGLALASPRLAVARPCTDADPPELVISSPARAATLQLGGTSDTVVTVEVLAGDTESTLISLVVEGVERLGAPIEPGRIDTFHLDLASRWGLNTITASAEDGCGNRREVAQSYIRSGAFFPAATAPADGAQIPGAVVAQLNQIALDDGDRSDLDDVTSLANAVFGTVAWNSVIPVTVAGSAPPPCTFPNVWVVYRITRGTVTATAPRVDYLRAETFGLSARTSLASFSVPLIAEIWECVLGVRAAERVTGTLGLSNASATVGLTTRVQQGNPIVEIQSLDLDGGSPSVTFDCGPVQFICDAITSLVIPLVQGLVEQGLGQGAEGIPFLIEDFLGTVRIASEVTLPPPVATSVQLTASLERITPSGPSGSGFLRLGFDSQTYPDAPLPGLPTGLPGAPRRDGGGAPFGSSGYGLGVEVKDDLVNQVLWAIWYGGGLDLPDLRGGAAAAGFDGVVRLSAFGELPPVMMPAATPGRVEIGIGDLFVAATVDLGELLGPPFGGSLEFETYVSAIVEGALAADSERQKLVFQTGSTRAAIEIVTIDDQAFTGALPSILEPVLADFVAGLVEVLVGSIPLPSFPLSGLVGSQQGRVLALGGATVDRPRDDSTRIVGLLANRPDCGDGRVLAGEACDDANRTPGDGCDDACRVEVGFVCAGQPSFCEPLCGDGFLDASEACDDGNSQSGDGCDAACRLEPGFECAGEPSTCAGVGLPIFGTRLEITNRLPDDEKRNRIVFASQDEAIAIPIPDTADDPRCQAPGGGGGAIAIASATSGQSLSQELPCRNWKLLGKEAKPRGYQYLDEELADGPCRQVTIVGGKMVRALCKGSGPGYLGYDLKEGQAEPPVAVRLAVGGQHYCAEFGGIQKDGSDGRKLVAVKSPPPARCR